MAREPIAVRVLVVSRDVQTIEFLCHQMQQLAIQMDTCGDAQSATSRLCRGKFEGIIIDLELGDESLLLLEGLREMTSHRAAISYAIVGSEAMAVAAFQSHATFVLQRPLAASSVQRTLRAAYPMMFRERRRCYRHQIEVRTLVKRESGEEFWSTSVNISESGMAISCSSPLAVGERVRLRLEVPGVSEPMVGSGEICWNTNGRAGMRFVVVPYRLPDCLQLWLSEEMSDLVPGW